MRRLRAIALCTVICLVASAASVNLTAQSANAADACADALIGGLDGPSDSVQAWTQGLATVGKMADGLPLVGTSPGSVLGFPDLLHQWFNNGANHLADATSC